MSVFWTLCIIIAVIVVVVIALAGDQLLHVHASGARHSSLCQVP